ncbi:MAG TPA: DNA polymerase III subunit chi [Sphingomicrobium sp.]|nr:DNA polymerase III subunit chi [Sphingomicrobium sp.]
MQVDFYQLGQMPAGRVIADIAQDMLSEDARLLVVAEDESLLARLDRMLWDEGPASFLPHGLAGGADDARQPILLSTSPDAPNLARTLLIADGQWREAALGYDRAYYLFDDSALAAARLAWKLLAGREGVERRFWAQGEDGRWKEKG